MSSVFLARDPALRRDVVVKVLPPDLVAGVNIERFRREILVAAGLQNPHIVPVLFAGEMDGLPWFTTPFVQGESLRQRLAAAASLLTSGRMSAKPPLLLTDFTVTKGPDGEQCDRRGQDTPCHPGSGWADARSYGCAPCCAMTGTTHRNPVFTTLAAGVSKRSLPRSVVVASESIVSNAPPRLTL